MDASRPKSHRFFLGGGGFRAGFVGRAGGNSQSLQPFLGRAAKRGLLLLVLQSVARQLWRRNQERGILGTKIKPETGSAHEKSIPHPRTRNPRDQGRRRRARMGEEPYRGESQQRQRMQTRGRGGRGKSGEESQQLIWAETKGGPHVHQARGQLSRISFAAIFLLSWLGWWRLAAEQTRAGRQEKQTRLISGLAQEGDDGG